MVDVLSDLALIGKFYAYVTKVVRDATGRKRKTYVDEEDWLLVYEDPSQWRLLLETMRLKLIFDGKEFHAKIALPTVQEEKSEIVLCTSRSGGR